MSIISEQINGKFINVTVNSSNIKSASYNTEDETLSITFKTDAIYAYEKVPWVIFTKFRMSESQGKFFTTNINGKYKHTKIDNKTISS
jgi:hypothetical protein